VENAAPVVVRLASGVAQEQNGIAAVAELNSLIDARQETAGPHRRARTSQWSRKQDDVRRQIDAFRTESIRHPRSETGSATASKTRVQEHLSRCMIDFVRMHGADDRQLICHGSQMRQHFRHGLATLAMLSELKGRTCECHFSADEGKSATRQK